jgi:hypothetical protein
MLGEARLFAFPWILYFFGNLRKSAVLSRVISRVITPPQKAVSGGRSRRISLTTYATLSSFTRMWSAWLSARTLSSSSPNPMAVALSRDKDSWHFCSFSFSSSCCPYNFSTTKFPSPFLSTEHSIRFCKKTILLVETRHLFLKIDFLLMNLRPCPRQFLLQFL